MYELTREKVYRLEWLQLSIRVFTSQWECLVLDSATKWIAVALFKQEQSFQPPWQMQVIGFGLPPIAVIKMK